MKKILAVLLLLFIPAAVFTQNLAVNPGFETDANNDGVPDNWVKHPQRHFLVKGLTEIMSAFSIL